jgi:hypothetical protein
MMRPFKKKRRGKLAPSPFKKATAVEKGGCR